MKIKARRPVYLDLLRIRMPPGAMCSFAHRVSGLLLSLALPFAAYVFALSLRDAEGYLTAAAILQSVPFRLAAVVLLWSLFHHLFAGIRFLLIDIDVGVQRDAGQRSARLVNIAAPIATLLTLVLML